MVIKKQKVRKIFLILNATIISIYQNGISLYWIEMLFEENSLLMYNKHDF